MLPVRQCPQGPKFLFDLDKADIVHDAWNKLLVTELGMFKYRRSSKAATICHNLTVFVRPHAVQV